MSLKRKCFVTVAAVAVTVVVSGSPAWSAEGSGGPGRPEEMSRHDRGPGHDPVGPIRGALRDLDLSIEQREQIRTAFERHRDGDLQEVGRAFAAARRSLEQQIWNPVASEAEILEASNALADRARAFDRARRSLALDILPILTAEQQNELREKLKEMPGPGVGPGHRRMR